MNTLKMLVTAALLSLATVSSAALMTQEDRETGQRGVEAFQAGDYQRGLKLWKPLVDKGIPIAIYNYGLAYQNGLGVKQDYTEAAKWYQKAAEKGYYPAQHNLGLLYLTGKGVKQDDKQATYWFAKAAKQGDANAQYMLGLAYYAGQGVPQDAKLGFALLLASAKQNFKPAQQAVSQAYLSGNGVERNVAEAEKWLKQAGGYVGEVKIVEPDNPLYDIMKRMDERAKQPR